MAGVSRAFRLTGVAVAALTVLVAAGSAGDVRHASAPLAAPTPGAASSGSAAPSPVAPSPSRVAPIPSLGPAARPEDRARALAARLADEDLVGQVLMPYAFGRSATEVSDSNAQGNRALAGVDTPAEMIAKYRLGGLILVGFAPDDPTGANQPTTNVDSARQVHDLTAGLQAANAELPAGSAPLLIGTDQEYGVVTRIRDLTALPSAMAFGAAGDPALTERAWRAAGIELAALGVNVDFAPVADVLGAGSPIGSRSYGADARAVATQVGGAVRGLQSAGVAATLKHFPGHGHTTADSHESLPVLAQPRAALDAGDLPPFAAGIRAGADLVMSGHLDVRSVDPGRPATFSHTVLTDLLRGRLRFGGVVVTDAMNMPPARAYPPGEAAVRAVLAGNDLVLMPPDLAAAHAGLLAALRDGRLPRAQLVASVTRVLTLKFRLAARRAPAMSVVRSAAHATAVQRVAAAAITVLRGSCRGTPVAGPVTVTASAGRGGTVATLVAALRSAGVRVVPSGGRVVHLVGYGDRAVDLRPDASVTVAMDTPYLLGAARSPVLLATYSSSPAALSALAAVFAGRAKTTGRSPVPVPGLPRSACVR
jgi:beta-N-acetylhexosaminidase